MIGWVGQDVFRLRKRTWGYNSFRPILTATVRASGSGSNVHVQIAPRAFVQGILAVWVLGFVSISLFALTKVIADIVAQPARWKEGGQFIAAWTAFFFFILLFLGFLRNIARDEARFLEAFVRQTLQTDPDPENDQAPPALGE